MTRAPMSSSLPNNLATANASSATSPFAHMRAAGSERSRVGQLRVHRQLAILRWLAVLLLIAGLGWSDAPLSAQQPAAATVTAPGLTKSSRFPGVPGAQFYRGNSPMPRSVSGFYFHTVKLLFWLASGVLVFWTWKWINEDATNLKVRPEHWNTLALLGGTTSWLVLGLAPNFALGVLGWIAAYAGFLAPYVLERNRKVPENARVLTPRHLRSVGLRLLARLGVRLGKSEGREQFVGPPIVFFGKTAKGIDRERSRAVENSRGFLAAKELVYDAILRRSTDIHLEPKESELAVRLRIDGVMYPAEPFDRSTGENIVNIFKVLSTMDITERRKPQDGSFSAETEGREIDFRVATQGTQFGEKMSLRVLDQSSAGRTLIDLGVRKQMYEQMCEVVHQPHGMFLTCGPTGAGKSTTLFAALREINAYESNIITIEDPVEYKMENVTQIEINSKAGQTFATALRSILRQDPDVVMVGEIRDGETAKIACQAANTGHMVFSTVHANDTFTALFRLMDLGVEPFLLASSLSAILGQRLCRKLCNECKEAFRPADDLLEKAGLQGAKLETLYRPPKSRDATCPACNGLGFLGRTGVYELLVISERLRDMIRETPNLSQIRNEARKGGMLYMKEEGLRLVAKGVTSLDELLKNVK